MEGDAWNVVITVHSRGFRDARRMLRCLGAVEPTHFFNVLIMRVENREEFLRDLNQRLRAKPYLMNCLSRVVPVSDRYHFISKHEFEFKGKKIIDGWLNDLAGHSFHVRMHRRGYKGSLSSLEEEKAFDRYILGALQSLGLSAKVDFSDPDYIIDIETIESEAGFSIWSRDQLKSYPFLNLEG